MGILELRCLKQLKDGNRKLKELVDGLKRDKKKLQEVLSSVYKLTERRGVTQGTSGEMIKIRGVHDDYVWLGNMSSHKVTHEGQEYRTAEALSQALRFDNARLSKPSKNGRRRWWRS